MKKNNTAEKTIRDAEQLTEALKKSTEKSLKDIMNEAITKLINEDDDKDSEDDTVNDDVVNEPKDDNKENSYEVEDLEPDSEDADDTTDLNDTEDTGAEGEDGNDDVDDTDDEWSDMEQYKVGDNDYDFTGVDGETALKVYNKLGDDDQICIKKIDDGKYELKDNETDGEYVIELGDDAEGEDSENIDADTDDVDSDTDIDIDFDDDLDTDDEDVDITTDDGENDDDSFDIEIGDDDVDDTDDEEDKLVAEENLGYTTNYQKDVIPGLNTNEPANSKDTYSMDGGAPEGNARPYGKKGNGEPFKETVNENGETEVVDDDATIDEGAMTVSSQSVAKETHTPTSEPRANHARQVAKNLHAAGEYKALQESARKIYNKAKEIQAENQQYKKCIDQIKVSLREAAVLNVTLGQIVKLLSEETTNAKEKKDIVERFNNVKTIKESKMLYDTIKRELNESKKNTVVLESVRSANPSTLNETTIYQNIKNNPSLDLMNRMDRLYK